MPCRWFCLWAVLLLTLVLGTTPSFAEGLAVAGINGKIQGLYGQVDGNQLKAGAFSLTSPLCRHAGVQLDGAYGEVGEDQIKGVGLHLFTRDPERFLLGVLGAHAELQNVDFNRVGLEGELYWGAVTIASFFGKQLGDIENSSFATLDLRWYPTEELMLVAGASLADSNDGRLHIGGECPLFSGLSAFIDLAVGQKHYEQALVGLKYYFGTSKSLLRRHREDDPTNPIVHNLLQGMNGIRDKQREIAARPGRVR